MNAQIVHMLARYFYLDKVDEIRTAENEREKAILATPDNDLAVGDKIRKEFSLATTELFNHLLVKYGILADDETISTGPTSDIPLFTDRETGDTVLITSVEKGTVVKGEGRADGTKPHTVKLKKVRHVETTDDKEKDK